MFWSEPTTLKSPIGRITEKYAASVSGRSARATASSAGTGSASPVHSGRGPSGASPVAQASSVPSATATRPPGRRPRKRTRPK